MTEYVLDSHACLFALTAPKRLGRHARRALTEAENQGKPVWIPAAVVAELVILKELGRIDLGYAALERTFAETTWRFLPLDWRQIEEFAVLGGLRDPFDRFIVSAARSRNARLLSRDSELAALDLVEVVWN